ncbi:MAG TPA: lipopolysaccharide biosynthesis protein [Candidatus Limnocylindrales bacterium]|jgi:O-antigen/teichoic acid export membrane protein
MPGPAAPQDEHAQARGSGLALDSAMSMAALVMLGGTRVVYGSILSHATDRETFGVVGLLIGLTMIGSFLLPAGIGSAISRYIPFNLGRGDAAAARGLYRLLLRVALVAGLPLAIGAFAIARLALDRPTGQSIEVALLMLVYALYTVCKAGLYGFGRVGFYLRLEIISSVLVLALALAVAVTGSTSYLAPLIVGYGAFAAAAAYRLRTDAAGAASAPDPGLKREVGGFVILACLGTLASAGFLQSTQFLAATFAPVAQVASFAAAVTLVAPVQFLPRALALAMFPWMAAAHGAGDVDAIRRQVDLSTRALVVVLTPPFAAGIILAPEILKVFGGEAYVDGAHVLQLILVGAFLSVIQVGSVNALSSASDWQLRIPVAWAVIGALSGLAFVALAGPVFGSTGVAGGYILGTLVSAAGPIAVVWRRWSMPWGGVFARATIAIAMSLIVAVLVPSRAAAASEVILDVVLAGIAASIAAAVLARDIRAIVVARRRP